MKKVTDWWKMEGKDCGERRYVTLLKSLLLAMLPLVCCLVYCGAQGRSPGEVYLPSSEWNDELFYYKQVESILKFGYPQGYYGFNESHALKLSFAAWSPALVFPWILWGLVFGWNLMSPVVCNIFLLMLCCFAFVWLVRPSWRQLGILTFLFCLYTPFVRYMLSVMPEIICFTMVIVFLSLAINYLRREKTYKLVLLFGMAGMMTLMRPYLLLFLLLPCWLWIRRDKNHAYRWVGLVGSASVLALVLGLYACIKHYFGAEYFAPLFFTEWISAYFDRGLIGGFRYTLGTLYYMGSDFLRHMVQGFRTGLASGAYFAGYLVCMGILLVQTFGDWRRWKRLGQAEQGDGEQERGDLGRRLIIEAHLAFSFVAMLFALLLMYKLTEGSKHLLTFMAAAVFIIALMDTRFYKKAVLAGMTFAYFFFYMARDPYDYGVPFVQEERKAAVEDWGEVLEQELSLEREKVPNYENVVIWVFRDTVDGTPVNTAWQLLYALPEGFGISCCMPEYVTEQFDSLQSRYLVSPAGGEIAALCEKAGYRLLYEADETVIYERYR